MSSASAPSWQDSGKLCLWGMLMASAFLPDETPAGLTCLHFQASSPSPTFAVEWQTWLLESEFYLE